MSRPLYCAAAVACSVTAGRLGVWWPATIALGSLLFLVLAGRAILRELLTPQQRSHTPPRYSGPPPTQPPPKPRPR